MGTGIDFEEMSWGTNLSLEKHFSKQQNATCSYSYLNSYYINYLDTVVLSAVLLAMVADRIQICNLLNCDNMLSCYENKLLFMSATDCKIKITQQKYTLILELGLSTITDLVVLHWH